MQKGKVTFVEGDWLRRHTAKGKKVPPCQDLPEQAKYTGPIDDNVLVLVVSYCWASKTHPDPQAKIMKEVCEFIEYLEKSRQYGDTDQHGSIRNKKIVVFLDYMSLPQKSAKAGTTFLDMHRFNVGLLECVNVLYASKCTMTLICSDSDKHSLEPRTSYRKSGWTMFEMFISMMVKHSDMVIDLPRALEWIRKNFTNPSGANDQSNESFYFLREDNRRFARVLPVHPDLSLIHI